MIAILLYSYNYFACILWNIGLHFSQHNQSIDLFFNFNFLPKKKMTWCGSTRWKSLCIHHMFSIFVASQLTFVPSKQSRNYSNNFHNRLVLCLPRLYQSLFKFDFIPTFLCIHIHLGCGRSILIISTWFQLEHIKYQKVIHELFASIFILFINALDPILKVTCV
jgi:hypothetical protein